jgi:hypothetical protein
MNWEYTVETVDTVLGTALIAKLWFSGLFKTYRIFCLFFLFSLASSYAWLLMFLRAFQSIDYRIVWLSTSFPVWLLTVFMAYSHMDKILVNLPGIAKLSRKVLNRACIGAIAIGVISAIIEGDLGGLWDSHKLLIGLTAGGIIVSRMVASIALLVFLAVLTFLLWFPVSVSRNVASLTLGLLVYFAGKTFVLLARGGWSEHSLRIVSTCITIISSSCFAYWIVRITPQGERAPLQLRLPWRHVDEERLMRQLELLDRSVAQAARRNAENAGKPQTKNV